MARLLGSTTALLALALAACVAVSSVSAHEPWKGAFECPAKKVKTWACDVEGRA
jgi:hypothetical protein